MFQVIAICQRNSSSRCGDLDRAAVQLNAIARVTPFPVSTATALPRPGTS